MAHDYIRQRGEDIVQALTVCVHVPLSLFHYLRIFQFDRAASCFAKFLAGFLSYSFSFDCSPDST